MPHGSDSNREKKPFYGRFNTPRTRSGCLRCRKRKLKCDERKPRCVRCHASDQCCQYGLKLTWKSETLSGRVMALPNHSPALKSWLPFLNTNAEDLAVHDVGRGKAGAVTLTCKESDSDDFDDNDRGSDSHEVCEKILSSNPTLMNRPPALRCSPLELSSTDSILLDFHVNRMCSTCTLLDGRDNGYKHVILPILLNSPLLMKSVLAVSANHLRFLDSRYCVTALQYRGSTLKSLQRSISSPKIDSKFELLSTILMLCFFDISDGCQSDWLKHLKGAKRIMMHRSSTQDAHSTTAVVTFLAQYFASHNVMAYTAVADPTKGEALQADSTFWLRQIVRPEQEIDCITGCSKELMSCILKITHRVREMHMMLSISAQDKLEQLAWKASMEHKLEALEQHVPIESHATSAAATRLQSTALAFRDAAVILLQHLDPLPISSNAKTRQHVASIILLLSKCPIDPSGSRSSSLWPLFIAACHVESDEERLFILKRFHSMESRKRFGNISPVREVVECVWKRSDLRADDVARKEDGNGRGNTYFEWEDAMAFLGSNLSLT